MFDRTPIAPPAEVIASPAAVFLAAPVAAADLLAEQSGPWLCDCGRWFARDRHDRDCERFCHTHQVEVDPGRGCNDCYLDDRAAGVA